MSALQTIKGFADLFEPESTLFTRMEDTARRVFGAYGYKELRIPILEFTELFSRSIGTETDVVQKEMYTFPDRKGRSLTMRPEATAGIMRAYIESGLHGRETVSKLFSFGPMFRYERPQKGRMRQFHQLDCECLGAHEPQADVEVMLMLMFFLKELGLTDLSLELNTLGCRECRPAYKEALTAFFASLEVETLCEDCRRRLSTNPLRILDCKVPACKAMSESAPRLIDHVCGECKEHFDVVIRLMNDRKVPYTLNPRLVRGLDYYMRTTFEVVSTGIGAQGSVAGGGRYDGLVAQLGGPEAPGIGFACGMERLGLLLAQQDDCAVSRPDFYIACLDERAPDVAVAAAETLRSKGLAGEISFAAKGLKGQMRRASTLHVRHCLLLGESELDSQTIGIKNMDTGEQVGIPLASLGDWAEIRCADKACEHRLGAGAYVSG
jgi:histidyl-tRNA synthetase